MAITKLTLGEQTYTFDLERELTARRLKKIKGIFGLELGRYATFLSAFAQLDPDAMICTIWIARCACGEWDENAKTPNDVEDFPVADWDVENLGEPESENEPRPTSGAQESSGSDSTPTQTTPTGDGSDPSPASAT